MNDLLDRIFELPPRQRVLVLVGTVLFLFLAYAYFFYWPRAATIQARREQLVQLRAERARKAALVAHLDEARQRVAELRAKLREAVAQLPDTKEIPELLSNVSAVGRAAGLQIIQFRQRPEVYRDFYAEVPVEILVRGTFFQVEDFFGRVSRLMRIVNVKDIEMKAPAVVESDPVVLETACAATTFRFLDEAERRRIAAEKGKAKRKGRR